MITYNLRNVVIYGPNAEVIDKNKPYFELNLGDEEPIDYKVSVGFLLEHQEDDSIEVRLAREKIAYDNFKAKVFKAIKDFDHNLSASAPRFLFVMLNIYGRLVEIENKQDYILGSEDSLKVAKPLAEVYRFLKEEESRNRRSNKEVKLTIGGLEVTIGNTDFVEWLLAITEKAIVNGDYNFNLGYNMLELEDALINKRVDKLTMLANEEFNETIMEDSRFLTSFCLNIHKCLCSVYEVNYNKITLKQKELYIQLSRLFEVPGWQRYKLLKGEKEDRKQTQRENKKVKDAFTKLLQRGMSDMVAVI